MKRLSPTLVALASILCGCERSLPALFAVADMRALSRSETAAIMGPDWTRRTSGSAISPTIVLVTVTSDVDLARYVAAKHAGISVAVCTGDASRRQLELVAPWIYSRSKSVNSLALENGKPEMSHGVYHYQIALSTSGPANEVDEVLQRDLPLCLRLKAAYMVTIYESRDIILTKAMPPRPRN